MIGSQSIKELQAVCGRDYQACYGSLSGTKEFTLLTYHYDVVIAKSAPHDMKNNITNSFINTIFLM